MCAAGAAVGAACSATVPCALGYLCAGGTCSALVEPGGSCTPTASACNVLEGLYCEAPVGVPDECAHAMYAQAGGACGVTGGAITACAAAGFCKAGTCIAAAADGAACDTTNGPGCTLPATCSNGTCALPEPSACP
jgi:hypothetical protein